VPSWEGDDACCVRPEDEAPLLLITLPKVAKWYPQPCIEWLFNWLQVLAVSFEHGFGGGEMWYTVRL